jgi:hypothetical protein
VEQAAVGTSADLVDDVGLEIGVDGAGNVFAVALNCVLACAQGRMEVVDDDDGERTSLGEEGRKAIVLVAGLALLSEVAIGLEG